MSCSFSVCNVSSAGRLSIAFAIPKSMTLGTGTPVVYVHQDVGRLDIAVDDALLGRVLDCVADLDESSSRAMTRREFRIAARDARVFSIS